MMTFRFNGKSYRWDPKRLGRSLADLLCVALFSLMTVGAIAALFLGGL